MVKVRLLFIIFLLITIAVLEVGFTGPVNVSPLEAKSTKLVWRGIKTEIWQ